MKKLLALTESLAKSPVRPRPKRRRCKSTTPQSTEALEQRTMLSNVTVSFENGDLRITGDSDDNIVEVTQTPDRLIVEGHDGTNLNGFRQSLVFQTADIPDDVIVSFPGGDNGLLLNNLDVGDDVSIRAGRGDDTILSQGMNVGDGMRVRSGSGNDVVFLIGDTVNGRLDINSGSGDDKVGVGSENASMNSVKINTSRGRDAVFMGEVFVPGLTDIRTGSGRDFVYVGESTLDDLRISTARGNDDIYFSELGVDGDTTINGGSGIDSLAQDDADFATPPSVSSVERSQIPNLENQTQTLLVCILEEILADFPDYELG